MALNLERRVADLEAAGDKNSKPFLVRLVSGDGTLEQQAEHAALRAAGNEVMVVSLVALAPKHRPAAEPPAATPNL
ncbi:hypothetical protein H7F36_02860 [Variovorax sp. PAMC28562]|uniref:hypothetical protein n=1 Tax=Variovorax sp. PAMC28562 TaxID=2762323 RepID=UPI00164E785B|nr:hypothetical protein [Variovorax sp. PAMC28562]QNK74205.1 hypothetical protein H7F36_02860 [Variovorax sp. PAMC28562]